MEYAVLVTAGMVAGLFGGLLGIGGSLVMIPAMVMVFAATGKGGDRIQQFQAAAMIVNFLLVCPSVIGHAKAKAVLWDVWRWLAPAAIVGIIVGVGASQLAIFRGANQKYMKILFGAFLIYVAFENARKLLEKSSDPKGPRASPVPVQKWWKKVAIGLPMGFSSGLLSIGGGALAVPALQMFLGVPLRNAIGTSAVTIMAISWLGAAVKNISVQATGDGTIVESLKLVGVLAPPAMIGSYIGGHLTHSLPLRIVRAAFTGVMLVSGLKMLEVI